MVRDYGEVRAWEGYRRRRSLWLRLTLKAFVAMGSMAALATGLGWLFR